MKRDLLGVALCGGASRRMGSDKAALIVRPGVVQLDYVLGLLDLICQQRAASVGRAGGAERLLPSDVARICDAEGIAGPMAGVVAALRFARGKAILVCACDMPYLEARHLVQLVNRRDPEKAATAFLASDGSPEPMCAIYEAACLEQLEARAAQGNQSLRDFLRESSVEPVAVDEPESLASVNDPAALRRARAQLDR